MLSAAASGVLASILSILQPVIAAFFDSFGRSLNDFFDRKRADQNAKDLGRVTAERDQETEGRQATERELEAKTNAPQTVDDAIAKLEGDDEV